MNNKNVYSLNNTFEGKIWVDWKGKDGKMGQEISWREKHFYSAEIPTHWHLCEVYLTVPVPVPVPACTRVKDYGRVPCAVCRVPNLWLRPAANNTHVYGNRCIQWYVNTSLHFEGIVYVDWKHRIGHRPMFQKKHRPSDRQAKLTSVDPYLQCTTNHKAIHNILY